MASNACPGPGVQVGSAGTPWTSGSLDFKGLKTIPDDQVGCQCACTVVHACCRGDATAVPTGSTHHDQDSSTLLPIPPLQVAHHSLSEAGSRGGEGVEPEGLGVDERSITSTSSRGARPQHPGHRRALVTLWDALHRTPMAAQQGSSVWPAAYGVLSTPCFWPWS